MNTLYRIYTEDVNREGIIKFVSTYFTGFTVLEATGVWEGKTERSIVIEIVSHDMVGGFGVLRRIAEFIKEVNGQDAVLITRQPVESRLI